MTDELRAAAAIREFLLAIGLDPEDPRLAATPDRVATAYLEFFAGVGQDPTVHLRGGQSAPPGSGTVALRDIAFRSICVHHLLPFSGLAHIAYQPTTRLVGIGSFARALETLSSRPQLQETLGQELADSIVEGADAVGAVVVLEARHACMADRGPREASSSLVTLASSGSFVEGPARIEALRLLDRPREADRSIA